MYLLFFFFSRSFTDGTSSFFFFFTVFVVIIYNTHKFNDIILLTHSAPHFIIVTLYTRRLCFRFHVVYYCTTLSVWRQFDLSTKKVRLIVSQAQHLVRRVLRTIFMILRSTHLGTDTIKYSNRIGKDALIVKKSNEEISA